METWEVARAAPTFVAFLQGLALETITPLIPPSRSHCLLRPGERGSGVEPGLLSEFLFSLFSPLLPLCPERNLEKHSEQQRQENQRPDGLAAARLGPGAQAVRRRRRRRRVRGAGAQEPDADPGLRASPPCSAPRTTCIWNHSVYLCAICLPSLCPPLRHPLPTSPSKKVDI